MENSPMQTMNPYGTGINVASAQADERAAFIRRTYLHLAGALAAMAGLIYVLLQLPIGEAIATWAFGGGMMNMLLFFGGFIGITFLANRWAHSSVSPGMQYLGFVVYIAAESVFFLPLIYVAVNYAGPDVVPTAALITGALFGGLTLIVFTTGKDFSFLRGFLMIGGMVAFGLIIAGMVFGFNLGLLFSGAMVIYAGAMILYTTSAVMRDYNPTQHVAAALALFASVALLFWYVLRIVMAFRD